MGKGKDLLSKTKNLGTIYLDKVRDIEKQIEILKSNRDMYTEDRFEFWLKNLTDEKGQTIIAFQNKLRKNIEDYKREVDKRYSPKGDELTKDAELLRSGVVLNASDLGAMYDKYASEKNITMQRLVMDYAELRDVKGFARNMTTKKDCYEAADSLESWGRNLFHNLNYAEDWVSDEYFEKAMPSELVDD